VSKTVAEQIADYLAQRNVSRIFGLCGGHIQPMWDAAARCGIEIVDVRHEGAAVMMAHAAGELTGDVAVAMVTAGPGVTNAATGIANAFVSGVPLVVISGRTPRPQTGMGAMQDIAQSRMLAPICQSAESVWDQRHVVSQLDAAFASALGVHGRPGPAYVDFPVDLQEEPLDPAAAALPLVKRTLSPRPAPAAEIAAAASLVQAGKRVLVIAGRSARTAREVLPQFLEQTESVFLDSAETKGLLAAGHERHVPAVRGKALREADLVITLGRRLDFQLAYGSAAVFAPGARFLRIGNGFTETAENRPGDVEIHADVAEALTALVKAGVAPTDPDTSWVAGLQQQNRDRVVALSETMRSAPVGADGRMHPYTLIGALNEIVDEDTVVVADGGDILSFARVGLRASTYLDCGPLGCLGVGIPFANAAAIARPQAPVIALIGDGSFGFLLAEIDTAVRRDARVLFVVANNEAWNIERHDQDDRFAGNLVGVDLPGCRYDLVARGLGAHGELVENAAELREALARARNNLPAVVNVMVTRDASSPDFLSGLASVPAYQALATWDAAERTLRSS
jgi:acetolactate synthase I/II/III large subunit